MNAPARLLPRACPACKSQAREALPAYSLDEWAVARCTDCGFVYLSVVPPVEAMAGEFEWDASSKRETRRRRKAMPILKRFDAVTRARLHLFPRPDDKIAKIFREGAVVDVGCGTGHAFPPGPKPYGVEISPVLAKLSGEMFRARGGEVVEASALEGMRRYGDAMFDGAIIRSFLEHEHEPGPLLDEMARTLKPGGRLYIKVPNYGSLSRRVMGRRWCGFRWPDHVNYFTLHSLRDMLVRRGFSGRPLNALNLPFDDNIHFLAVKG